MRRLNRELEVTGAVRRSGTSYHGSDGNGRRNPGSRFCPQGGSGSASESRSIDQAKK